MGGKTCDYNCLRFALSSRADGVPDDGFVVVGHDGPVDVGDRGGLVDEGVDAGPLAVDRDEVGGHDGPVDDDGAEAGPPVVRDLEGMVAVCVVPPALAASLGKFSP